MATDPHTGDGPGQDVRERPLGDLVKQLAGQTSELMHRELDLAKAEVSAKGREAGKGAGMAAGAAAVALLGAGALTAFLILLLDDAVVDWLAALIVGVVLVAVAAVIAMKARNELRRAAPAVPEQTVETMKEDVEWARTRGRSART
jgi:uncharacterized membrane protein YqjE